MVRAVACHVHWRARMRSLFLLGVLLAVGCSSSSSDAPAPAALASVNGAANSATSPAAQSGSRLRAKYVGSGEARQLVGFFDTQRQEDCTFQPAESGRVRCLPTNMITVNGTANAFSDAACTVGTAPLPTTGCASPTYVLTQRYDESTCAVGPYQIRKVLPASAPAYQQTGSTCAPAPASASNVLKLGDFISWGDFAEGTITSVAGALTERRLTTTDGAGATYGYHLDSMDADCRFRVMADGTARCVPDALSGPLLYTDSNCSQPSAFTYYGGGPTQGCGGQSTAVVYVADGTTSSDSSSSAIHCSGISAIYNVLDAGTPVPDVLYESLTPTATNRATCSTSGNYFSPSNTRVLGANITGSLPAASRSIGTGGRIVPALVPHTGEDLITVLVPGFHDTQLDIDCTFETASDGKLRCLPTAPAAQIFSPDLSCMSPASIAVLGADCASAGVKRYGRTTSSTCPETTTVYALADTSKDYPQGSVLTGPSRCAKVAGITSGFDATVADPAQFAEGTITTE